MFLPFYFHQTKRGDHVTRASAASSGSGGGPTLTAASGNPPSSNAAVGHLIKPDNQLNLGFGGQISGCRCLGWFWSRGHTKADVEDR